MAMEYRINEWGGESLVTLCMNTIGLRWIESCSAVLYAQDGDNVNQPEWLSDHRNHAIL